MVLFEIVLVVFLFGCGLPILVPLLVPWLRFRSGKIPQVVAAFLLVLTPTVTAANFAHFLVTFDADFSRMRFWLFMTTYGHEVRVYKLFWQFAAFNLCLWWGVALYARFRSSVPRYFRYAENGVRITAIALLLSTSAATYYLSNYRTLEDAVRSGDLELARKRLEFNLLGVGPNSGHVVGVSSIGSIPCPLLPIAAQNGDLPMAQLLIEHGANLNSRRGWGGDTPLNTAIQYRQQEMVEFLLSHGADPTLSLHDAAAGSSARTLTALVERGADVGYRDAKGKTALDVATDCHNQGAIAYLSHFAVKK